MIQFAVLKNQIPANMNNRMIATLINTITLLTFVNSRIPITSNALTATMMNMAGTLRTAPECVHSPSAGL